MQAFDVKSFPCVALGVVCNSMSYPAEAMRIFQPSRSRPAVTRHPPNLLPTRNVPTGFYERDLANFPSLMIVSDHAVCFRRLLRTGRPPFASRFTLKFTTPLAAPRDRRVVCLAVAPPPINVHEAGRSQRSVFSGRYRSPGMRCVPGCRITWRF